MRNAFFFWDTTHELYTCEGNKMGELSWKFDWWDLLMMGGAFFPDSKILDPDGNHVGNLIQDKTNHWFSWYNKAAKLTITDLNNVPLVTMQSVHRTRVTIETYVRGQTISPPAMTPQFITLVFANQMAGWWRWGPIWGWVINIIFWTLFCCCCCGCCCYFRIRRTKACSCARAGAVIQFGRCEL